ncbi:MAG: hypothetical protein M1365_00095, partial [Actinobacteria bacterium]|nr:hypothetical protein [Actinomycetota bacterium]
RGGSKTAAGQTAKNSPSSSHEMNILKEMKEMALQGDPFEVYQVIKKVGEGYTHFSHLVNILRFMIMFSKIRRILLCHFNQCYTH